MWLWMRFISTLGYRAPATLSALILTNDVTRGRELATSLQGLDVETRSAPPHRLLRMWTAATADFVVIDWDDEADATLAQVRASCAGVPAFALLPTDHLPARLRALQAGVDHYVAPPVDALENVVRAKVLVEARGREHAARQKLDGLRLWGDWVRYLVHDLRNPVTVAMTSIAMAQTCAASDLPDHLVTADTALGEIAAMLRDVLDTDRIKHGAIEPLRQEVDLAALAREVADAAPQYRVVVRAAGDTRLGVDLALLRRVFGNLIANAGRFARNAPIEVEITGTTHGVSARVVNDGPAIPPAIQPHLFEPWTHVSGLPTGTGIGLAFCRLACEAHGGTIWLDSGAEGSVAFAFGLPRRVPDAA